MFVKSVESRLCRSSGSSVMSPGFVTEPATISDLIEALRAEGYVVIPGKANEEEGFVLPWNADDWDSPEDEVFDILASREEE